MMSFNLGHFQIRIEIQRTVVQNVIECWRPTYRDDEWERTSGDCHSHEQKLHCSTAGQWTPVQQIVYHMLRAMLFEDISSSDKLEKAANAVVDWKLNMLPLERYAEQYEYEKMILAVAVTHTTLTLKALQCVDQRLQDYFIAVTIVCILCRQSMHSLR